MISLFSHFYKWILKVTFCLRYLNFSAHRVLEIEMRQRIVNPKQKRYFTIVRTRNYRGISQANNIYSHRFWCRCITHCIGTFAFRSNNHLCRVAPPHPSTLPFSSKKPSCVHYSCLIIISTNEMSTFLIVQINREILDINKHSTHFPGHVSIQGRKWSGLGRIC